MLIQFEYNIKEKWIIHGYSIFSPITSGILADDMGYLNLVLAFMWELLIYFNSLRKTCYFQFPSYLIIVDALDEINDQGESAFLKELLDTINAAALQGLKFLITSQLDPNVSQWHIVYHKESLHTVTCGQLI